MKITKEVISDLYPLYAEQECSGDTRALVEEYLQENPREAEELRRVTEARLPSRPASAVNLEEVKALREARRRVRWRGLVMGFAIFFTLAIFSVQVNDTGVHWLMLDSPWQAGCFALAGGVLWTWYVVMRRSANSL